MKLSVKEVAVVNTVLSLWPFGTMVVWALGIPEVGQKPASNAPDVIFVYPNDDQDPPKSLIPDSIKDFFSGRSEQPITGHRYHQPEPTISVN